MKNMKRSKRIWKTHVKTKKRIRQFGYAFGSTVDYSQSKWMHTWHMILNKKDIGKIRNKLDMLEFESYGDWLEYRDASSKDLRRYGNRRDDYWDDYFCDYVD